MTCGCVGTPVPMGTVVKPCQNQDGGLWIHVLDDEGKNVKEVIGKKNGGDAKPSDDGGLVRYDPLPEGVYTASIGALTGTAAKEYELPARVEEKVHVAKGQISYAGFELKRRAQLKIRVEKAGDPSVVFTDAEVEVADGPDKPPKGKTAAGILSFLEGFGKVKSGLYKVKATLKPEDAKKYATVKDFATEVVEKSVSPGGDETVIVEVEPKNLLRPKIEAEYKVVLLDRGLGAHQDRPGEAKIKPDPTRVEITLEEKDASAPDKDYGGTHHGGTVGVLTCTPANVDIFLDEACTPEKALPVNGELTAEQLKAGTPLKLYLRGKTAGKCKLKIVLKDPVDRFLAASTDAVEFEVGVVELVMTLHHFVAADFDTKKVNPWVAPPGAGKNYDPLSPGNNCADYHKDWLADYHKRMKDLVLPDQKAMTDQQKIAGKGRLLSTLAKGGSSRAKLVVKALVGAQWPDVPDDYVIYLNRVNTSGGVRIFDAEVDGDALAFPVGKGMKVSELKAAEKVFWVEGLEATKKPADVQLDLTLDRDDGGLAKEPKRNGDAARFTVVGFKSMKLEFTPEADKPVRWDPATERAYVNLVAGDDGRKYTFGVQLSEEMAGVKVHFALCPDPNNQKAANSGVDIPKGGEVKWDDTVALTLSGADAGCFEVRDLKKVYLKDGVCSVARKAVYWVQVHGTYSDGSVSQYRYGVAATEGQDTTAGVLKVTFSAAQFVPTREKLWKWHEVDKSVKSKDKTNPDDYFHLSAVTDAKGYAKVDLWLSRYGGDVFVPSCYIDQDVHMARYVEGHTDLGKREPFHAEKKVKVWRRAWLQKVVVKGVAMPDFGQAISQYDRVRAEVVQHTDLELERATVNGYNPRGIYPRYMIEVNGGTADAVVVSDPNKGQFFNTFAAKADKPNMIPVLVCDAQWDPKGQTQATSTPPRRKNAYPIEVDVDVKKKGIGVLDPPLQGGTLLISGTCKAQEWDDALRAPTDDPLLPPTGWWGAEREVPLAATDVDINRDRTSLSKVRVRLPDAINATHASQIWIEDLVVKKAGIFLGESSDQKILAVYDPAEQQDFQNTIAHEVGHAFSQVMYPSTPTPHGEPTPMQARTNPLKVPAHPNTKDEEAGNHCRHLMNRCVMYDSGPTLGALDQYCAICHPYLLVLDMSKIQ